VVRRLISMGRPKKRRVWEVMWRASPTADGMERLGQAVKLVIGHGHASKIQRAKRIDKKEVVDVPRLNTTQDGGLDAWISE
jgi:hypothetical protein